METVLPILDHLKICAVCGQPSIGMAQDFREIPSESDYVNKIPLQNWRGGCAQHRARSKTYWLNGTVTERRD